MIGAGDLNDLVAFDVPSQVSDGFGGLSTVYGEGYRCRGNIRYLRGSEAVQTARLEGRQPVIVTIWQSALARTITTDWRMRDVRRGETYNVRAVEPAQDRRFIELLCEKGVAA